MKVLIFQTLLALAMASAYRGSSPHESFYNMSPPEGNDWTSGSKVGCTLGFIVFGCAYLGTVVAIFLDINKNSKSYDDQIQADLK